MAPASVLARVNALWPVIDVLGYSGPSRCLEYIMRQRWIETVCVALLVPLPQFVDFADIARWVRFMLTGNEALLRLPGGESIVTFSPLSFGLLAAAALAMWGIALLSARWLQSRLASASTLNLIRFVSLWILLAALSAPITLAGFQSHRFGGPVWMLLKIGTGVLLALLAAKVLSWVFAPRKPAQP